MQDHFGFPINARPFLAIGTLEKVDIGEVLNQIVKRACLFEKPKIKSTMPTTASTTSTTSTTMTTAYRKLKLESEADLEKMEVDRVLIQPVVAEAAYPNLVSIISKKNLLAIFG